VSTIETNIDIAAPASRVWEILVEFAAYADWNPYLVRVEGTAEAGAEIIVTSRPGGDGPEMKQPVRVVSVDPPHAMRWEGGLPDRSQFLGDHWFELQPVGDARTRLHHFERFSGSLANSILEQHGDRIRASFDLFNRALKARAEQTR